MQDEMRDSSFYGRWAKRWASDLLKAWKEQLVGVALAVAILICQIRYSIIRPGEIKANAWAIAWPYICLFALFLVYHFFRAPLILDRNRQDAVNRLETQVKDLESELEAKDLARPNFSLEAYDGEIHSYTGSPYYFWIRNCGQRTARNSRFDRILSKSRRRGIQFDPIPSIASGERLPLSFRAGVDDDWTFQGVANQILLFCEDNPAKEPKITCPIVLRFLDGDTEREEHHVLECQPLLPTGVKLRIYPGASKTQRSTNVAQRDWIGEWGESKRDFTELEKSDVFAEFFRGDWSIRSDHDSLARDRMEAACDLAGSRLFNSPGMSLSDVVRSQNEHWKRWLHFLRETQGLNRRISVLGSSESGYIERLAQQSALACTKCAAKAFN